MNSDNVILVDNISMKFNMCSENIYSLKEYVVKMIKRELFFNEFWALNSVSFEVKRGEVFGIVGLNGAGKSTLLKVIAGVLRPTVGTMKAEGSIAPLIELGAGFDIELTGRENIFLNGAILGYSRKFMEQKFNEIINFSELHDFIDVPLKNYSSGMVARLGFAIATIVNPDILIVDEVLSVGDFRFQQKCENKIKSILENNTTVIFVSHSIEQVEKLCDRAIWIEKGNTKFIGTAKEVCRRYKEAYE